MEGSGFGIENMTMQDAFESLNPVQHTLKNAIHCAGVGLHSGARVKMTLHPAEVDTGVVFKRADAGSSGREVAACWQNAVETPLCTTLLDSGLRIATTEHLLSALHGLGIDNALIEVDGAEIPILDGSALPFVEAVHTAGRRRQRARRRYLGLGV